MNKFESFEKELDEFSESIPFFGIPGGGLELKHTVTRLRFHLGFGTGPSSLRHDKEVIENALPILKARIDELNFEISNAWFFQKESIRRKRDILVKIHNYALYALELIAKDKWH